MNPPGTDRFEVDPLALDEGTAERLLAGDLDPADAPPGYAEVAALLAAAVAEPTPDELAGRAAVVAELKAVTGTSPGARTGRATSPGRRRRVGLAIAMVVGALSTGGLAVAATGQLPEPIREATRTILTTVGVQSPGTRAEPARPPATSGGGGVGPATAGQGGSAGGGTDRGPRPTATPSITSNAKEGLCQAFFAGQGTTQGRKADAAAFKALAAAAGGADKITAFCQQISPSQTEAQGQKQEQEPGDPGQGQGGPPSTGDNPGQGQGRPPSTRLHGR